MARGDSLERQLKLMQLLEERRQLAVPQVARELGAAVRTVYRDLVVLERVGVPIYPERRGARSRWRVLDGYRRKLTVSLSWPELVALSLARDLLGAEGGSMFHSAASSGLDKIRSALPAELLARVEALSRETSAVPGAQRDQTRSRDLIPRLIEAIERQETVQFQYRAPKQKRFTDRTFDPHHLHLNGTGIYVIGYAHEHGATRTYLVERMRGLVQTGQHFERQPRFHLQDYVQGAFGPWSGKPAAIRLRFSPPIALHVAEQRLHPTQTNQLRDDGALDMALVMPLSPTLVHWLVGFGGDVRVNAPRRLAELVRAAHVRAVTDPGTSAG